MGEPGLLRSQRQKSILANQESGDWEPMHQCSVEDCFSSLSFDFLIYVRGSGLGGLQEPFMCVLGGLGQCIFHLYRSAVLIGSRAIDLVGFKLGGWQKWCHYNYKYWLLLKFPGGVMTEALRNL